MSVRTKYLQRGTDRWDVETLTQVFVCTKKSHDSCHGNCLNWRIYGAGEPAMTHELFERALADSSQFVVEAAASNPCLPADLLENALFVPGASYFVQVALVQNPAVTAEILDRFFAEDCELADRTALRSRALSNPKVPAEHLRRIVLSTMSTFLELEGAASNPVLPIELVDVLLGDDYYRPLILRHRKLTRVERMWIELGWKLSATHRLRSKRLTAAPVRAGTVEAFMLLSKVALTPAEAFWAMTGS